MKGSLPGASQAMGAKVILLLALLTPSVAWGAESCKRLTMVDTIDIVPETNGTRVLVPVSINGARTLFMLDTGGDLSQISTGLVRQQKLPVREIGLKLLDERGFASAGAVIIDKFRLGRQQAMNAPLMIAPDPDFGKDTQYAGLLAADRMGKYDLELDTATGKLNFFSPDHCPGHVIYWPADTVAAVPIQFLHRHISVAVSLDGHAMTAEIDTGASGSTMDAATAKRVFDVTEDTPGILPQGANGDKKAFIHAFHSLTFEGVTINNPQILVYPNQAGSRDFDNARQMNSLTRHEDDAAQFPELLIGMEVIGNLHTFFAFSEGKLYITPK
jgi:predicted aspartyl protease